MLVLLIVLAIDPTKYDYDYDQEHEFGGAVPAEGIEPTHPCEYQILSLARLPVPPRRLFERLRNYEIAEGLQAAR